MASGEPLIRWNKWADGMARSPHVGNGLIQCAEIDTFEGAVRAGKKPQTAFHTNTTDTFTADAATDICTTSTSLPNTGTAVYLTTTGTLPAGLSTSTVYFIIKVTSTTFKLATTIANANASTAINITDAGTGTHTFQTVDPATINHYVTDPRTSVKFAIDSNGRVWYKNGNTFKLLYNSALDTGSGALTNAAGQGLAIFRTSDGNATYLFAFRNAVIDVVNVFGTSQQEAPSWTNSWKSMNSGAGSGNPHHAINGQDNIIYFCDDRYVGSIAEKAGSVFDPATAGTYTYNNQALDLPLGSQTQWLEQLGINLLIAVNNDSYIYPWDRSSDSYGLPIPVGEYGVYRMKNIGNIVYIMAGTWGNIYWTQGTYVRPFVSLPQYATYNSTSPASNPVSWGGVDSARGTLLVGVGALSGKSGVWRITADGKMTVDNFPSTGQAKVTAISALNDFYEMGYSGGADTMDTSRYSSLGSIILQSPLYRIGNFTQKATISQIEYQIASPVSGSIRIGYRTNETDSFTNIPSESGSTTTFALTTAASSGNVDCGLTNLENIQLQAEIAGNVDLMEIRCFI